MVRPGPGEAVEAHPSADPLTDPTGSGRERVRIEEVSAAATRPLRQRLLRPHQQEDELVYPGDLDPEARHYAAVVGGEVVGIASVSRQEPERGAFGGPESFRLRGMATVPAHRGRGIGTALLERVIGYAAERGGDLVWCTARMGAAGFYRGRGFRAVGEAFDLPRIGPHVVMMCPVAASEAADLEEPDSAG